MYYLSGFSQLSNYLRQPKQSGSTTATDKGIVMDARKFGLDFTFV